MEVSNRLKNIPPYVFAEIGKAARQLKEQGIDIINLGIGDPDQPTPGHIVEAMHKAIDDPANHKYPVFGGLPEYKQAAAAWLKSRFSVSVDPEEELTSLIGSKEGIHNTIMAFVDAGDMALIPDPSYPVYGTSTILAGGRAHFMPLKPENSFLPDFEAIPPGIASAAKLMIINYPNNPTAAICSLDFLERAVAFASKHDILLVSDLAYPEMTFDGYKAHSVLEVAGAKACAVELHSLSKSFNMTGWRIGFAAGNAVAVKALAQLKSNIDTDVFRAIQIAGIAALTGPRDHIDYCNKLYVRRRDLACRELGKLGWKIEPVRATFYMWLPVPPGSTSVQFCRKMLEEAGIVVPPGTAYGATGEGFFRLSLCADEDRLKEAFARMAKHAIVFETSKASV